MPEEYSWKASENLERKPKHSVAWVLFSYFFIPLNFLAIPITLIPEGLREEKYYRLALTSSALAILIQITTILLSFLFNIIIAIIVIATGLTELSSLSNTIIPYIVGFVSALIAVFSVIKAAKKWW